ncbi:MAG: tetratricopeptide repeat protein [Proteobacteria bacterium]|nr:tetratricopeptide repeat protein [Pseudomonadota bacterium]
MHRFLYIAIFILSTGPVFAASSIQNLQHLIDQKLYDQAARSGEKMLQKHAGDPDIEFLTAYAYQMNQQSGKAAKYYQELIRQYPELPEPRNNLAMIYLSDGDYDRASELLVNAINTHRSYATAYANLSNIYTGIASEAYRRAVSESNEPDSYANNIELTALTRLTPVSARATAESGLTEKSATGLTLVNQIIGWAKAWSEKDLDAYLGYYSNEHKLDYPTHRAWVEHRKKRILRPGFIRIEVGNFQIRAQSANRATIDFEQSFNSLGYSDRVIKRLRLNRINSKWKITDEMVLSVL